MTRLVPAVLFVRMPFSLSKKPLLRTRSQPECSARMPAPLRSVTRALRNSTLSMVTLVPETTQMPLPPALLPSANSRARPPTPQMVRLLLRQVATSPR